MSNLDDPNLLEHALHGDRRARERLVADHLGDVRAIAWRYRNLGLPVDDLVQEGAIGLIDAIDHFDRERCSSFERYARFRIRRAIRNALTDKSRVIRLPKQMVERMRAIDRLSPETARETRRLLPVLTSLDQIVFPDGSPLEALVPDAMSPDPVADVAEREETEFVDRAVAALPERQREVICRHFGFDREPEEVADVATELHLSQQRVRAIERDALFTLRDELEPQLSNSGSSFKSR